jgi:hypothetical protein
MRLNVILLFIAALFGLASQSNAEKPPKELRKMISNLYELLLIEDPELLTVKEISTVKSAGAFLDNSYTFFRIEFRGESAEGLKKISPILARADVRDTVIKEDLESLDIVPQWPETALEKNEGLFIRWEFERKRWRADTGRIFYSRAMTLKCVFNKKEKMLYGFIEETTLPTNGNFPDIVVEEGHTVYSKSERREQGGTNQPATRPDSKPEGSDKPQPEAEGRSR